MKINNLLVVIVFLSVILPLAAQDQKTREEWIELSSKAIEAYQTGRYKDGISNAEIAYDQRFPVNITSLDNSIGVLG